MNVAFQTRPIPEKEIKIIPLRSQVIEKRN
jgi:hypothetical protein